MCAREVSATIPLCVPFVRRVGEIHSHVSQFNLLDSTTNSLPDLMRCRIACLLVKDATCATSSRVLVRDCLSGRMRELQPDMKQHKNRAKNHIRT